MSADRRGHLSNAAERPLLSQVRELADLNGWLHYHAPQCQHARLSEPGFPDLILVRAPMLLAIEVKREPADRPTTEQMDWLRAISEVHRGESYVLRPGPNLDELVGILK